VRKPKDKAKVEGGVLVVERWILARLRNRTFFSLDELNQAITELLEYLNSKPMQKLKRSRREQFERLDRPALKPLAPDPIPLCRMENRQGECGLPHRAGRPLLLGALSAGGEAAGGALQRPHRGMLP
jgi:hypothetical protein